MRMRRKGTRGEPLKCAGQDATFIENMENRDLAKVLVDGGLRVVSKDDLSLPIIDTKDYEKIEESVVSD